MGKYVYSITVREVREIIIYVEADDERTAKAFVQQEYNNGSIKLTDDKTVRMSCVTGLVRNK